jgi:hypothetical protein
MVLIFQIIVLQEGSILTVLQSVPNFQTNCPSRLDVTPFGKIHKDRFVPNDVYASQQSR